MAQQLINLGAAPNDGTGTPLRTSFDYTNQNFTELYAGGGVGTSTNTQVLFNDAGVLKGDAGLVYNKTTDALTVAGALSVGGAFSPTTLNISGTSTLTGAVSAGSTLAVTGTTTLTGAATLSSTLAVTGTSTLTGAATVQGNTLGKGNNAIGTNIAFGNNVLAANTTGLANTGVGHQALQAMQNGTVNSAFGISHFQLTLAVTLILL